MILINKGKYIGPNAILNGWKAPKRPVIYFDGKSIKFQLVQSATELNAPLNQIQWAVGGGSLPYRPIENFGPDVTRVAERTGLAYKGDKVYLIATKSRLSLKDFGDKIQKALAPDGAIFLDGGGSTQMYFKKSIVYSTRPVDNGIFVKE